MSFQKRTTKNIKAIIVYKKKTVFSKSFSTIILIVIFFLRVSTYIISNPLKCAVNSIQELYNITIKQD